MIIRKLKKLFNNLIRNYNWRIYANLYKLHGLSIKRNKTDNCDILYLLESPELLTKVLKFDFKKGSLNNKVIIACFDKPKNCKPLKWINYTSVFSLLDRYCSFPDYISKKERLNKALVLRSSKNYLSGHKLRNSILRTDFIDIIDLDGSCSDIRPLYEKYEYAIVIENTKFDGYVSEKFYDAIKSGCIVIYWGSKKTVQNQGFKNIFFFEELNDLNSIIKGLVKNKVFTHDRVNKNFEILKHLRELRQIDFYKMPSFFLVKGKNF